MLTRLQDTGYIESVPVTGEPKSTEVPPSLDRPALLVYEGSFQSMDGIVDVTPEQLEQLASNHNSWLSKFRRMAEGSVPVRIAPPIQLDHSTSAKDTVGRVMGDLQIRDHVLDGGKSVKAIFTDKLRILGRENVEKVMDGRWVHLSMGADFQKGTFGELTITPFPAAEDARMLARMASYKGRSYKIVTKGREPYTMYGAEVEGILIEGWYDSAIEAGKAAREFIDSEPDLSKGKKMSKKSLSQRLIEFLHLKKLMTDDEKAGLEGDIHVDIDSHKGEEGETEMGKKLEETKPGEEKKPGQMAEEADPVQKKKESYLEALRKRKLEEMKVRHASELEDMKGKKFEELEQLAAEEPGEKQVDQDGKPLSNAEGAPDAMGCKPLSNAEDAPDALSNAADAPDAEGGKKSMSKLSADMRSKLEDAKVRLSRVRLSSQLNRLKADAKITPAEIKKIDLDKLSKQTTEAQDAVMKSYRDREPVVFVGYFGTQKAEDLSKMQKLIENAELEAETRSHFKSLPKQTAPTRLELVTGTDGTKQVLMGDYEKDFTNLCQLIDSGAKDEAKKHLNSLLVEVKEGRYRGMKTDAAGEEELSTVIETFSKLQAQVDGLVKLTK